MKPRNFWWNPPPRQVVLENILRLLEQGPWYEVHLEQAVHERTRCTRAEFANALEELVDFREVVVFDPETQKFGLRPEGRGKEDEDV